MKSSTARIAARIAAGALALAAVAAVPAPAPANVTPLDAQIQYTPASQSTCERPVWAWPYTAIGDRRTYVLAPYGSFTDGVATGWQLRDGARLTTDPARGTGLALPAGASAISPGMCVDLDYPHLRLAHKLVGKKLDDVALKIEVVYPQLASPQWVEVRRFDGTEGDAVASDWRISPDVELKPEMGGSAWGARYAALRFTAVAVKKNTKTAEFRVDDVFIDPRMRR